MSDFQRSMFAATETLRTRKTRVAAVGPLTLPRTVELYVVIVGAVAGLFGAALGGLFGQGLESAVWGAVIVGTGAIFATKFEPIRRHSLIRYLRLRLASTRGREIVHEGRRVRMFIGIAPVETGPGGPMQIRPGAIDIDPSSYDERGVPRG